ncbi:MAG TPA: hypothetical protein VHO26_05360 [Propionibacteriaceae bacterium]|nr:hypothetical protein [Propionibacteriaceae bacterium]
MQHRHAVPPVLVALAAHQSGVVSREQCVDAGMSRRVLDRLLRDRRWTALARGVYLVHDQAAGFEARCWGGVLAGGPRAVVGFEAAARLHGLDVAEPDVVDVFVPHPLRTPLAGPWRFIASERRGRGEPPRTLLDETVLDIASRMENEGDVLSLLADVVSGRRTTPARLLAALDERPRVRHRRLVRQVLGDVRDGVHSVLERAYRRDVELAHGLPDGRRQVRLAGRSDVLYEEFGVVVELDGRLGHVGAGAFRDLDRDNRNMLSNLLTLRFGHHDVTTRPCDAADQVGRALSARGWDGSLHACRRCRHARAS